MDDSNPAGKRQHNVIHQVLPDSIISCSRAETLTLSDQHVTFLLTHSEENGATGKDDTEIGEEPVKKKQSLCKLTIIPHHKELLTSTLLVPRGTQAEEATTINEETASKSSKLILSFLSQYNYKLTNESGAEYSFYRATPNVQEELERAINRSRQDPTSEPLQKINEFNVELISPASDRQIARAMPSSGRSLIVETPELYEQVTKAFIQEIVSSGSLSWVQNIINGTKEKERKLFENDDWLLNIDTKWRSHPDPLTVPKEEWRNNKVAVDDLYCLGISKHTQIASLRDLRQKHVDMLKSMYMEGLKTIQEVYGVEPNQVRAFVHYQPQFYHFHVHFTRIHNEIGCQVERGHLLSDIIQNITLDDQYYKNRDITYALSHNDKLFKLIEAACIEKS